MQIIENLPVIKRRPVVHNRRLFVVALLALGVWSVYVWHNRADIIPRMKQQLSPKVEQIGGGPF